MRGTGIEYVDDTLNLEIGCAGCELWTTDGKVRTCYAGNLVSRYAGHSKGYPAAFDKPQLFLERLFKAASWPDLSGRRRLCPSCETRPCLRWPRCEAVEHMDKPWLDKLPRFIFLNDLGDTFTEGLPDDWPGLPSPDLKGFSPLQILSQMKAIIMVLTKRATQMRQFFERYECPQNFIVMVSVTGPETINRVRELVKIKARWRGVSAEPMLRDTAEALEPFLEFIHWVAAGFESGATKRGYDLAHMHKLVGSCQRFGVPLFVKQLDKVTQIPPELLIRQLPDFTLVPT
jgi:protein gp37